MEHKACPSCGEWDKRRRSVCANDWHGKADAIVASAEVGNHGFTASLTEASVAPRDMELPGNPYEAILKLERVHGYLRANGLTGMFGPWCTVVDAKIILEHEINTSLYRERDAAIERYSLARLEGKRADG